MSAVGWIVVVVVCVLAGVGFLGYLGGKKAGGEFLFEFGPFKFGATTVPPPPSKPKAVIKESISRSGGATATSSGGAEINGVDAYGELKATAGAESTPKEDADDPKS